MEFSTLDKMVEELEQEKKILESKIDKIKAAIKKMKEEYRNENLPEAGDMVSYMIKKGKERLGKNLIEASDIPKDVLENFYEYMDRKVDTKRIVMACKEEGDYLGKFYFFFTDKQVYLWGTSITGQGCSIYPYKSIRTLKYQDEVGVKIGFMGLGVESNQKKEVEVKVDKNVQEDEYVKLRKVLKIYNDTNLMRLLLDLRDYQK